MATSCLVAGTRWLRVRRWFGLLVFLGGRRVGGPEYAATSQFRPQGAEQSPLAGLAQQFGLNLGALGSAQQSESPIFYARLLATGDLLRRAAFTQYRFSAGEDRADSIEGTLPQLYDLHASRRLQLLRKDLSDLKVSPLGNPGMPMKMPFGPDWFKKINWNIPNAVQSIVPGFEALATTLMEKTIANNGVAKVEELRGDVRSTKDVRALVAGADVLVHAAAALPVQASRAPIRVTM